MSCVCPDKLAPGPDYERLLDCIHCGLCLSFCPTYTELGVEMDSPRGRIYLMKALADGRTTVNESLVHHLYLCLDCRACETACPSGVHYGELIEATRERLEKDHPFPWWQRLLKKVIFDGLFVSPWRLRLAFLPLKIYQRSGLQWLAHHLGLLRLLPKRVQEMEALLPPLARQGVAIHAREVIPSQGTKRHRVGLLSGCVTDLLCGKINQATVEVLTRNGCEVVIPRAQRCCGALHVHNGYGETARALARQNLDAFEQAGVEAIITNTAGCGAQLKEYDHLLRHDPLYNERAQAFSQKVKDVAEFLLEIGIEIPAPLPLRVTYHDACHLAHGQQIHDQPRQLLGSIPGLELIPLEESDWCCGSAGIYNVTQPAMADRLLERKLKHVLATQAQAVAAANSGCLLQLQAGVKRAGVEMRVCHPVELLAQAYQRGNGKTP